MLKAPLKTIDYAKSIDPDETAHNELLHLDLNCLPSDLCQLNIIQLEWNTFF